MVIRVAPKAEPRPAEKIMEGLQEALAVVKGEAEPHAVHVRPGRPSSGKVMVTLRLDPEVIDALKADGEGWQPRANALLRKALGLTP